MLFNSFSLLALVNLVVLTGKAIGQDINGLPACAISCLESGYDSINKACAQTDFACLCKNSGFVGSTIACYAKSCPAADAASAQAWGAKSCAAAGVTIAANGINSALTGNNSTNAGASTPATNSTSPSSSSPARQNANSAGNSIVFSAEPIKAFVIGSALVSVFIAA